MGDPTKLQHGSTRLPAAHQMHVKMKDDLAAAPLDIEKQSVA